jgi:AcrR family transcriptional regulator
VPAVLRAPRERWINAGLRALAEGGPHAVRVEVLASSIGVTKGSFYSHFANRARLLTEMLEEWERRCTDDVLARVEAGGGDATTRIKNAGNLTFSDDLLPVDLAVRAWSRHDTSVAARLRRVDNARMEFLREEFGEFLTDAEEIEARSTLAFTLAIGRYFLATDHGTRERADAVSLAARVLFRPEHQ